MKKIIIILIISFIHVGSGDIIYQNNAFLILICNCGWLFVQWKSKPFITDELNALDLKASFIIIATLFAGLFSSLCQNVVLQIILMAFIIIINSFFLLLFLRDYLFLQLSMSSNIKVHFIETLIKKFWKIGDCFFFIQTIYLFFPFI